MEADDVLEKQVSTAQCRDRLLAGAQVHHLRQTVHKHQNGVVATFRAGQASDQVQ